MPLNWLGTSWVFALYGTDYHVCCRRSLVLSAVRIATRAGRWNHHLLRDLDRIGRLWQSGRCLSDDYAPAGDDYPSGLFGGFDFRPSPGKHGGRDETKPFGFPLVVVGSALPFLQCIGHYTYCSHSFLHAKSRRHAIGGAALGGLFLALLAFSLVAAMRTDPSMSQTMDMPMLAFAERLSPWVNILYGGVMLFAIYASATGNYYNFTLRLKASPKKKTKIILIACLGFLLGLMGFKNVVAYMFPLEGFVGIAIIVLLTINFVQVVKRKDKKGIDEDVREL